MPEDDLATDDPDLGSATRVKDFNAQATSSRHEVFDFASTTPPPSVNASALTGYAVRNDSLAIVGNNPNTLRSNRRRTSAFSVLGSSWPFSVLLVAPF